MTVTIFRMLVFVGLAFSLTGYGAARAQNLIVNSDFDADDASSGDVPVAFPGEWSSFNNAFVTQDVPAFSGLQSLKMYGPFELGGGSGAFQVHPATAGETYEARMQIRVDSTDLLGAGNWGFFQIYFYPTADGSGTHSTLTESPFIFNDNHPIDVWTEHSMSAAAPAGTQSIKLQLLHIQGDPTWFGRPAVENPIDGGAIFFDDIVLQTIEVVQPDGDYNNDGTVDAADYVLWRKNPDANGGAAGYTAWRENFAETVPGGGGLSPGTVPEPSILAMIGLLIPLALVSRNRR